MSIQKEVEKMYRQDEEKKKKNEKKKKSGRRATLVVLILIVILALLLAKALGLFGGDGLGFGKSGSNDDNNVVSSADKTVSTAADEEESSVAETPKVYDDIKVSGSTYLYKGSETTIDDLVDTFSMEKMNEDVVARIEDDNATQNAMEELTNALDDIGRAYEIVTAEDDESSEEPAA